MLDECVDENGGRGALAFTLGYRHQSITSPLRNGRLVKGKRNRLAIDALQVAFFFFFQKGNIQLNLHISARGV